VEILARSLESESNLHKRVDLFFLVDSIAQCSRGLKGEVLVIFKLYVFVVCLCGIYDVDLQFHFQVMLVVYIHRLFKLYCHAYFQLLLLLEVLHKKIGDSV
jgi:hypothetical protein